MLEDFDVENVNISLDVCKKNRAHASEHARTHFDTKKTRAPTAYGRQTVQIMLCRAVWPTTRTQDIVILWACRGGCVGVRSVFSWGM